MVPYHKLIILFNLHTFIVNLLPRAAGCVEKLLVKTIKNYVGFTWGNNLEVNIMKRVRNVMLNTKNQNFVHSFYLFVS
jgi:hypothetical protein